MEHYDELMRRLESAVLRVRHLLAGGAIDRPRRQMPSLVKIAQFHGLEMSRSVSGVAGIRQSRRGVRRRDTCNGRTSSTAYMTG